MLFVTLIADHSFCVVVSQVRGDCVQLSYVRVGEELSIGAAHEVASVGCDVDVDYVKVGLYSDGM